MDWEEEATILDRMVVIIDSRRLIKVGGKVL